MQDQPPSAPNADRAVLETRKRLAAELMTEIDPLVDTFITDLHQIEDYSVALSDGTLTDDDVRETALASFELLLRAISGGQVPPRLGEVSITVGRERAAVGIPLASVVQAMRLTFRIIWSAMVSHATEDEYGDLLEGAVDVWGAVESHIMDAIEGYQETEVALARERADAKALWFGRLLESGGRQRELVERVATVLDFGPDEEFLVIVARTSGTRPFRESAMQLSATGVRCHVQSTSLGDVFVAQLSKARSSSSLLAEFASLPCGVVPRTTGLSSVPRALLIARQVARAMNDDSDGPLQLRDVWIRVIAAELVPVLGPELVATCLAPFDEIPATERDRILDTVRVYLDSFSSIGRTAETLYCHRNTIRNRLHRFEELTGLDVSRPADAAVVLVSFELGRDASLTG